MKYLEYYNLNDFFGCIRYNVKNLEAILYTKGILDGRSDYKKIFRIDLKKRECNKWILRVKNYLKDVFLCLLIQLDIIVNVLRIFMKISSIYTRQMLRFFFRFLRINLGRRISYYDLCCDIRINANKPSANK